MEEHIWQIDAVKPKLVFLENSFLENYHGMLQERGINIVCMDPPEKKFKNVYYFWELIEKASDQETEVEHNIDEDIMTYRFTGGTTGRGKCAMSCHNITNY